MSELNLNMNDLELCALASGSNGNCYYIGNGHEALLVDVGLSARQLQLRITERGLDQQKIKAILITHEHSDHCRGARVLSKRLQVPVFLTKKTFLNISRSNQPELVSWFERDVPFRIGGFEVFPFSKQHDAVEACSFRIGYGGKQVGVMTDIGEPCEQVKAHFSLCHAVFLESNYDEEMLRTGPYPYVLKERVASAYGHLSNNQAVHLADKHAGPDLHTIFLSHLSGENNTPEKASDAFRPLEARFAIMLTSRHASTEVFGL